MNPYYQHAGITIYHGDATEICKRVPYGLICTDPPYGRNLSTGNHGDAPGFSIAGDSDTSLRDQVLACLEAMPGFVFGSPYCPRPRNTAAVLIWNKGEHVGMGNLSFPWKPTYEEIYVFGSGFAHSRRDGAVIYVPAIGGCVGARNDGFRFHPTEKPVALIKYLLERRQSEVVIDPFMGSGTTLLAAKDLGRQAIGIEIEEKYCEIAAKRLSQEVLNFTSEVSGS